MSRSLGATNCSCQQFKVHNFSSIIEGSTSQLVNHKALNLVDVGSSPMMGVTSYDVIFIEVYIKSQLNIILLSRPLGATHLCSNLYDYTYKCRRTRQTRVVSGWTLLRCLKGNCLWVTDMWASHLLGPHVMDTKADALRHRSIVLSGWSRVSDGRVAPSHPPPPPQKKDDDNISSRFHVSD